MTESTPVKHVQSCAMVHQIAMPRAARALSTLSHIDYSDAFVVKADPAQVTSAEASARVVLSGQPIAVRAKLLLGWSALGLIPATGRSSRSILGWNIRASETEFVLLGRDSMIGMPAELVVMRDEKGLLFCTFVQHGNGATRALWAAVEPTHLRVVPQILERAGRLAAAGGRA